MCWAWPARSDSATTMTSSRPRAGNTMRSGSRKQAMSMIDTVTSVAASSRYPTTSRTGADSNR